MASIGIIAEIFTGIIGVGVIGNSLPYPELQVALQEIKIIMDVNPNILAQGCIAHILVNQGNTRIGVVKKGLPAFFPEGPFVKAEYKSGRMRPDQV